MPAEEAEIQEWRERERERAGPSVAQKNGRPTKPRDELRLRIHLRRGNWQFLRGIASYEIRDVNLSCPIISVFGFGSNEPWDINQGSSCKSSCRPLPKGRRWVSTGPVWTSWLKAIFLSGRERRENFPPRTNLVGALEPGPDRALLSHAPSLPGALLTWHHHTPLPPPALCLPLLSLMSTAAWASSSSSRSSVLPLRAA